MQAGALHKAGELPPRIREAIEALLGRALLDDESVSIQTYQTKPAATGPAREAAYKHLIERVDRTAEKVKDNLDAEVDAAIDEAADHVRTILSEDCTRDTAVLVRTNVRAAGVARRLLERIASGTHDLVLSPFLLEETKRVLSYPRMQALYRLSPAEVQTQDG